MNKDFITTYTKMKFSPLSAQEEDINIIDIAHALSFMCRANGHMKHFYSVAQHCINCADEAKARGLSTKVQLACLLHDASEAYISDITRPVKRSLSRYMEIEECLQEQIFKKFNLSDLTEKEHEAVKEIDDLMLYHEFMILMEERVFSEEPAIFSNPDFKQNDFIEVKNEFIYKYKKLSGQYTDTLSVGIDGCKGKWIAVAIKDDLFEVDKFNSIEDICEKYKHADSMIIDIPVGLPENKGDIRPDRIIKKHLGRKGSSIFDTPCRQAIYAQDKKMARSENIRVLGKSLSEQSLAIGRAIHQVDHYLDRRGDWKNRLLESHPEYCFMILNNNKPVLEKKTEKDGQQKRLEILNRYYPEANRVVEKYLKEVPSRKKIDDVIDALCLSVIGQIGLQKGFRVIPEEPMTDSRGIKMQMVVAHL